MTLAELSGEYYESAQTVRSMILANERRLKEARKKGDRDRELALRRCIADLRAQHNHLLDVAFHLKTYYDPSPPCIH